MESIWGNIQGLLGLNQPQLNKPKRTFGPQINLDNRLQTQIELPPERMPNDRGIIPVTEQNLALPVPEIPFNANEIGLLTDSNIVGQEGLLPKQEVVYPPNNAMMQQEIEEFVYDKALFNTLKIFEGASGDTGRTDVKTGIFGLTENRKLDIKRKYPNLNLNDVEIIYKVIEEDLTNLRTLKGFTDLPNNVKLVLGDLSYNLHSKNVIKFPKLKKAVKEGNIREILKQTLDTAVVKENGKNKNSKGHAIRRAKNFNNVEQDPERQIYKVTQTEKGKLFYYGKGGKIIFNTKSNADVKWSKSVKGTAVLIKE
tara:strand:+ start:497 stop:1429 length:933 start_codon:yes stop_codon:yes gene_type:complete